MITRKTSLVQLYTLFLQSIFTRGQYFKHQSIHPVQIQEHNLFNRQIRDTSMFNDDSQKELPPPEDVQVAQVSENSVHFKWNLNQEAIDRNLDVTVMIYPRDNAHEEMSTIGSRDERIITNLESGKLYTFIIATTKDGAMCNPIVINQDTVPARPTDLAVSTFDFLDIELTFLGQLIPYRIETAGIEAQWKPPTHGECDCYDAYIYPDEGQMIIPADDDGVEERGNVVRQFIHLVPGKEYTISVVSTTCGNGLYGPLTSESVESIQVVPPGRPGEIEVSKLSSSEIELCWNGPDVGHYNQFQITWDSPRVGIFGSHIMDVNPLYQEDSFESDKEHRFCYSIIEDLASCVEFEFNVWTAYNEVRSLNPQIIKKFVPPPGPNNFKVDSFSEEAISLSWKLPGNHRPVEAFELRLPESEFINEFSKSKKSIELTNLEPGVMNEIHLLTYCFIDVENEETGEAMKLYSSPDIIKQTTRPMAPMKCDLQCELRNGKVDSFDVRSGMKHMYSDFGFYEDYEYGDDSGSIPYDPSDPYGENIINDSELYKQTTKNPNMMTDAEINNIYQAYGINLEAGWKPDTGARPGKESSNSNSIGAGDFSLKLSQEIYLNASWLVPQKGKWDGFILDYSPFSAKDFENIDAAKRPPYYINDGSTMIDLYLPRSDQQYTIYVRAVANGVESEALIMRVDCGDPKPKGDICMTQKELPAEINMQSNEVKVF